MSGYSDAPNHDSRPPSDPSSGQPYPSQPQQPYADQPSTKSQGPTVIAPPQSSERPRQTFSTFSIREPSGQSYTPRTGAPPPSGATSTPPTGPNSDYNRPQSQSTYPSGPPPANGYDYDSSRARSGPYDPYETPNQYKGPPPSGPNFDSRSGLPPNPADYPRRTDYIRSHAASPQPNVGGGLGGIASGSVSGSGDPRFSRNGVAVEVPPRAPGRKSASASPEKQPAAELAGKNTVPPRGPAAHEAGRTEQLREIPTGPSGKSRTANGANSPRPIPTAPASSSQPVGQPPAVTPATPQSVDADDDITELSSLAKLRQFKASIATKRSKQAHDVDSDAVAEMAASFSAPPTAVPATPSTLGLTTGPSQSDAAASDAGSDAAAINKAREQELKERLKSKAMKQEGGASPDVGKGQATKHGMEDGEIANEAKRARLELMPTSAGTTDESQLTGSTDSNDPMRSAGKRKRAAEWMKTTSVSQEPVAEPAVKQEERKPDVVAPSPVAPPRERSLMDRVGQQDTSKRERQTSPGDRAKPHKVDLKARARSRSPVKTSRAPVPGSKDPNWAKKLPEDKPRVKTEPERDSKPSLAERIGPSFAKDNGPRRPIDSDILDAPLGSRDRKDSIRSRPGGYEPDFHRRSRSPQRQPASRPYEPDNREPRSSISARDRPDYRSRDRELSPYSARQRSPARDSFRDDRRYDNGNMGRADHDDRDRVDRRSGYQRNSIGGYQDLPPARDPAPHKASAPAKSAPAPAAPAPPTEAVMETLAVLKAQISMLEAGLPHAASAAPAPAPAPAPQSRYPPAPPAQTRQAPPASSYPSDNRGGYGGDRYDRPPRSDYDRPPSPRGSRLAPPSAPPISAYDRARPISPGPLPIPLHAFTRAGASPVRYDRPLPPRYDDPRDAPQDYGRDDRSYRGPPPRGYDGPPPAGPPVRNSYDAVPRDYLPPSTTGAGYGGSNYRPPPSRDLSPPPNRPYSNNYDSQRAPRVDVAPPPRTEYRERYDPASRPGPPPQRYGSPVPSTYGGGAYSHPADTRPDYDSRYPPGPPPARRTGGFDNRAASAGSARGGAYAARSAGRGGYEGSVGGGRSDAGDRDRERDLRDRDYERDREREREMRERDRRDYDDNRGGDFGGRGGYRGDGGRGGSSLRGRI